MADLTEKVELMNNVISNISVTIRDFEERFDAVDNKLSTTTQKEKKTKEVLSLLTNRILSLERAILNDRKRIDLPQNKNNVCQQNELSSDDFTIPEKPSEAIELRAIGPASQREQLRKTTNIRLFH